MRVLPGWQVKLSPQPTGQPNHYTHNKSGLFAELKQELDRPISPSETERRELSRLVEPHLRQFYIGTIPQNTIPHTNYNARS